jgi:hypothetical protein
MRTVAERRFDDAQCLRQSGANARANGVFYLGGLVIECLLKARLVSQYPSLGAARSPERLSPSDREVWQLIYRSHELDEMLEYMPDIERRLMLADRIDGRNLMRKLKRICVEWTIFARYSPLSSTMAEAAAFLDDVKELKTWLKH